MILPLCFLLLTPNPSSHEICSAPGHLPAPKLYLSRMFAQPGDSVILLCSVLFRDPGSRIVFCKDGEEISSQMGLLEKSTYDYVHAMSRDSSGNYFCGYETKDSKNQVIKSQLSLVQQLIVTTKGGEQSLAMSSAIWVVRCILVLLLLVSAPVITFVLEKMGPSYPARLDGTREADQ